MYRKPLTIAGGAGGRYFSAFEGHVLVPVDLARALVFGAAAYARGFGFEPEGELAEEFTETAVLLGEPAGPSPIGFGRDGKPCFVNGPYDDPKVVFANAAACGRRRRFPLRGRFPRVVVAVASLVRAALATVGAREADRGSHPGG